MNKGTLKKTSEIEYMVEMANQREVPGKPHRRGERIKETRRNPKGKGNRRHSIKDTREEMERGREGKDGGKGHWTVNFRNGY